MQQMRKTDAAALAGIPYGTWILLCLPLVWIIAYGQTHAQPLYFRHTGLWSCWLLALTLSISPLSLMFGPRGWVRWLRARRRYFGVASFGYAVLHLIVFLRAADLDRLLGSFTRFEIATGWAGFAVMAAMAATSTDGAVRRMGPVWKRLQRLVYPGAALVLIHWAFSEKHYVEVAIYSIPVIVLMVWRFMRDRSRVGV